MLYLNFKNVISDSFRERKISNDLSIKNATRNKHDTNTINYYYQFYYNFLLFLIKISFLTCKNQIF